MDLLFRNTLRVGFAPLRLPRSTKSADGYLVLAVTNCPVHIQPASRTPIYPRLAFLLKGTLSAYLVQSPLLWAVSRTGSTVDLMRKV